MDIEIRPIRSSDIAGFHRAVDCVARERRYLSALEAPSLDSTARFVQGNIDGNQAQFVVVQGGEIVGWCDILPRSDPVRPHVGVLGMGLLAPFRARGIGRRVLLKTLEHAQQHRFRRIELQVRATNARALRLYASLGFILEGTFKDNVCVDGQFDSTHCMALFPETGRWASDPSRSCFRKQSGTLDPTRASQPSDGTRLARSNGSSGALYGFQVRPQCLQHINGSQIAGPGGGPSMDRRATGLIPVRG